MTADDILDPQPWAAPRLESRSSGQRKRRDRTRYASAKGAPADVQWLPRPAYAQDPARYPEWMRP